MEVVHTCPDVTYWSEVLYCTIPIHMSDCTMPMHMSDLEVKVTDFERKIKFKFLEAKWDS